MLKRMQGVVFALLGVGSLIDAWRIASTVRPGATFDLLGPDRYLMVLASLMIVSGTMLAIARTAPATAESRATLWPLPDHVVVLLALMVFALTMPLVGFAPACFAFFMLAFMLVSRWSVWRGAAYSSALVAGLYFVFVRFADVPLPRGAWLD